MYHHAAMAHGGAAHGIMSGAGGSFLQSVMHTIFTSMIWSTVFRITKSLPLPVLIVLVVVIIGGGYLFARRNGYRLF